MSRLYRKFRNFLIRQKANEEFWVRKEFPRIDLYKELLVDEWKGKLLDLGCGNNYFSKACQLKGVEAEGVDLDKCDFEVDKLPYEDRTFDLMTMHDVLEHLVNPENLFKEINRCLKMRGLLIIRTHDWKSSYKTFFDDYTRKRPYTINSLRKIFMLFGMKIRRLELRGRSWPFKKKIILGIAQRMK